MKSYELAMSHPHVYLLIDLKPTNDDRQWHEPNILSIENFLVNAIEKYLKKQSYRVRYILRCELMILCMYLIYLFEKAGF